LKRKICIFPSFFQPIDFFFNSFYRKFFRGSSQLHSGISSGHYKRSKAAGKVYLKKSEFKELITEASLETVAKVISRLAILTQTKVYLLWKNPKT